MFRSLANLLNRALGQCPRCMRTAFLAAASAWMLVLALDVADAQSILTMFAVAAAIGLTLLWLAHIAAFALRAATTERRDGSDPAASTPDPVMSPAPFSRRQIAVEFARVAALAAVATAFASSGNSVLAAGKCDCSRCSSNQVCCRTANGYCGCFPKGIKC